MEVTAPFSVCVQASVWFVCQLQWSLMLCSLCVIAALSRWHWTVQGEHSSPVYIRACILSPYLLMVLHWVLKHLQHLSQHQPLSFQMFTCPSKQTPLLHLTERDSERDEGRWEGKKWRERSVFKSATLHFVSEMAHWILFNLWSHGLVWVLCLRTRTSEAPL